MHIAGEGRGAGGSAGLARGLGGEPRGEYSRYCSAPVRGALHMRACMNVIPACMAPRGRPREEEDLGPRAGRQGSPTHLDTCQQGSLWWLVCARVCACARVLGAQERIIS